VAEETDPRRVEAALEEAMTKRLATSLGLTAAQGFPTEMELEHATRLAKERYGSEAFTLRR